jgi:hypothetical protein
LTGVGSVRRTQFIRRAAADVWQLVGAPERLHEWFPVSSTKVEGAKRWVTLPSGITFEEDIVTLDHELRRFQYRIVNNPIVTFHLATVDVVEDGPDRCLVSYSTDMEPEVLALPIGGAAGQALRRLREIYEG